MRWRTGEEGGMKSAKGDGMLSRRRDKGGGGKRRGMTRRREGTREEG